MLEAIGQSTHGDLVVGVDQVGIELALRVLACLLAGNAQDSLGKIVDAVPTMAIDGKTQAGLDKLVCTITDASPTPNRHGTEALKHLGG